MNPKASYSDFEIRFYERLLRDNPNFADALIPLAEAYTKKGLYQKGLVIDKRLAKLQKSDPIVHYNLACSFALIGERDKAFRALKTSIKLGYSDVQHLKRDDDLKSLHTDPRFNEILTSLNPFK